MNARTKRRRPARWHVNAGRPPSREARTLATSRHLSLPVGVWGVAAGDADALAASPLQFRPATHAETGARFMLACQPDGPILAISPLDATAHSVAGAYWDNPGAWANRQEWRFAPIGATP
jgi:hypothetical protein